MMGTAIPAPPFINTGLDVKSTAGCTASPMLPADLIVAAFEDNGKMTCQITGTPTVAAAEATYTITATSTNGGTDNATVIITVDAAADGG